MQNIVLSTKDWKENYGEAQGSFISKDKCSSEIMGVAGKTNRECFVSGVTSFGRAFTAG